MKVLVATTMRQGQVDDDFCYTIDGELVRLPFIECDCGDSCGCTRSFAGLTSHRATTTALVADRPDLDRDAYVGLLLDDLTDDLDKNHLTIPPTELRAMVEDEAAWLLAAVGDRAAGAIVRRRGEWYLGYAPGRD
jgi:hypothetical protein